VTFDELEQLLDKTEALVKYRDTKREAVDLREQLKKSQEELSRYKNLKTMFAGEETSLEEFERRVEEQTLKVYGEKIEWKVNSVLKAQASWPTWFKQNVNDWIKAGVKNGLDEAFNARVNAAIQHAKTVEWPNSLDEYVQRMTSPFKEKILSEIIAKLPITITKQCDKCGADGMFTLDSTNQIAVLVKQPFTYLNCPNPQCRDILSRHKVGFSLGDVIIECFRDKT
jgi:hypothetical protein